MFREMRRFKQQISKEECIKLLKEEPRGVLAVLGDDGYPYAMPMDHYYDERDGKLYFHGAQEGHKIDAIKKCDKVSYCVYNEGFRREGEWMLNITSVIAFGKIRIVEDEKKREEIARNLGLKFYPNPDDVEKEIKQSLHHMIGLELTIEHMTGKLVNES